MSTNTNGDSKPDWWRENERIRSEMELPPYDPPRFEDGIYTHEVIDPLESRHDCTIRFMGVNTHYGDDWEVRIDGEPILTIGHHRDKNGNTVYETTAEDFREHVLDHLPSTSV